MKDYYIFYSRKLSFEPNSAHEIHDVLCANAAANLGYPTVSIYHHRQGGSILDWVYPFQPKQASPEYINFYNTQDKLKVFTLPVVWPIDRGQNKFLSSSTLACKYYLPLHLLPHAKLVHTQDWNFAKAAIKNRIPVIYESHYYKKNKFDPEIVKSPFLQVSTTQSELIRQSQIEFGMPAEKAIAIHNGFSRSFLTRKPQEAELWRRQLLERNRQHLVVYSGALYRFKGVDDLIEAARELPQIQFVITGGTEAQVKAYQQFAKDKQADNVKFLGWVMPRARLVSLFQAADVLAHPHTSGKAADFTNPVKFFQYMASGTPIVATEILPLLEFKSSRARISWCEPDNPIQLARCIQNVLETYPRKVDGYSQSIEFARQFSWENRTEKILSHVENDFRPISTS